jgi:hypothetical protein
VKYIITFTLLFLCYFARTQTNYSYSYIEPCSGKQKTIEIPQGQNNVTVNYYGNVSSFNANDFNSGVFSSWMNSVAQVNSGKPCGEISATLTNNVNMTVTQNVINTVMNVTSIAAMAQSISGMTSNMSGGLGNSVSNAESGGSGGSKKNEKNNGNSSQNNSGSSNGNSVGSGNSVASSQGQGSQVNSSSSNKSQGSSTNTSTNGNSGLTNSNGNAARDRGTSGSQTTSGQNSTAGESSTRSGNGQSGSLDGTNIGGNGNNNISGSGTSTGASGTGNGASTPTNNQDNTGTSKSSGGGGGSGSTANSISNAEGGGSGGSSKGGVKSGAKTGQMIGAGDVVALKSAEDPTAANQYRFTTSLTRANTNNTKVFGLLGNYTTGSNNTNITAYMALMVPKSQLTIIGANSSMMNFERDFFNTTTTMLSKRFKGGNWKKLTVMGGLNYTIGNLGETRFTNLSAIFGGFYSFNVTNKISGSILCLAVYSPFTQFYDGQWWNSSTLIVPFSSWDYAITKTFKFNISFSGVYELNETVLNYQVLTGGKILF